MKFLKYGFVVVASAVLGNGMAQDQAAVRGKSVYEQSCLACHQADGSGIPNLAPPMIKGVFVNGDKAKLINIVINGMEGVEINGEHYANPMPGFAYLTDGEIADVLTYIRSNFKNAGDPVTEAEVKAARNGK